MTTYHVTVPALPIAQPRAQIAPGGRKYIKKRADGSPHPIHAFKAAVMAACRDFGPQETLQGPVWLSVSFFFPRPKSHMGTGRNAGKLKPSAPALHVQRPDVDNLAKGVMDAMTQAGVWRDDDQIVRLIVAKAWRDPGEMPGVEIEVRA